MQAGTALFFKDFRFKDGGISDKLVIVLNTPQKDQPYLLCPTTSKQHHRKSQLGCHSEANYFYVDENQDNFDVNTWILFHVIYEKESSELLSEKFRGKLYRMFDLDTNLWDAVRNCILKSGDIELDYLEMIEKSE